MMLRNNHNRLAAKIVANTLRSAGVLEEFGSLNAMQKVGPFHPSDVAKVRKRLEVLIERFDRDAELPEEMADWRESL